MPTGSTKERTTSATDTTDAGGEWLEVGRRLRAAREGARVSVRELARRIDVSASHISQVERGLGSYSVSTLYAVASELGLSLDSLFEQPSHAPDPAERAERSPLDGVMVLRADDRPRIKLKSGPRWERLTVQPEPAAEFLEVIYAPHAGDPEDLEFNRHEGVEYGIVISGALDVQVGFDTTVLLPGDSIRLDSTIPHRFWNSRSVETRAIWFEARSGATGREGAHR